MSTRVLFLVGLFIFSCSAAKCPVCEDKACDEAGLTTCVVNDPNNPVPPYISKPTTTTTSTTTVSPTTTSTTTVTPTTPEGSGDGSGDGGEPELIAVDGLWNDNEGFLFPFAVKEDAPRERQVREIFTARDLPFDAFYCLNVEFNYPENNDTHVQKYCIEMTKAEDVCDLYRQAVGEENVKTCTLSTPNSAVSYSLQSMIGMLLLSAGSRLFV